MIIIRDPTIAYVTGKSLGTVPIVYYNTIVKAQSLDK